MSDEKKRADRQWYPRDKVYIHGTDGCSNCETGRITLFVHSNQCIRCNPSAYEAGPPVAASVPDEDVRLLLDAISKEWIGNGSEIGKARHAFLAKHHRFKT